MPLEMRHNSPAGTPVPHSGTARIPASHRIKGYLFIAAAAFFWGGSAAMGKAFFTGRLGVSGEGKVRLDPLILSQARTTFSFLILAPVVFLALRGRGLRMPRKDFLWCLLIGILGLAPSNYFYYLAIDRTSVATAIILQYTAPVWVLIYMVSRGIQRATAIRISAVALAVIGCAVAIGAIGLFPLPHLVGLKLDVIGIIAAQLAALSFAFYNIAGHTVLQSNNRWSVITHAFFGATVFWAVVNPPWRVLAMHYSGEQWGFLLIFAIFSVLVPFSFYFAGLQFLDATRAIVTSCLEPIAAILFAALVIAEPVKRIQVLGMALVITATVLIQLQEKTAL